LSTLRRAAELEATGQPFVIATVVWRRAPSSGRQGSKAIISPTGTVEGWLGGACAAPTVVRRALESLEDGRPRLLVLGQRDGREGVEVVPMACESEGAMEVYLEPVLPTPELVVVGDSPMVGTLVEMAGVLGWRSRSIDNPNLGPVGEGGYVIVATQGHYDEPALRAALATPAGFIGLVASAKRASSVLEALRAEGVDEEQLARVRAPAGLDLGHTSHEEVAVAVLAELVVLRAAAGTTTPSMTLPEVAIDPVCGMEVDHATARFSAEHEGTTYWFCAAGCQRRFEEDPGRYL
jgi:xanthine dehydrogenase accessory factor